MLRKRLWSRDKQTEVINHIKNKGTRSDQSINQMYFREIKRGQRWDVSWPFGMFQGIEEEPAEFFTREWRWELSWPFGMLQRIPVGLQKLFHMSERLN